VILIQPSTDDIVEPVEPVAEFTEEISETDENEVIEEAQEEEIDGAEAYWQELKEHFRQLIISGALFDSSDLWEGEYEYYELMIQDDNPFPTIWGRRYAPNRIYTPFEGEERFVPVGDILRVDMQGSQQIIPSDEAIEAFLESWR
jgi:hypothetical protein